MLTSHSSQSTDGFTVLETLVAFAVLSISIVATNMAIGLAISSVRGAAAVREAQQVAAELLATLPGNCTSEQQEGVVDGRRWRYRLTEMPAQPEACQVQLDIYDKAGRKIRSYLTFQARNTEQW